MGDMTRDGSEFFGKAFRGRLNNELYRAKSSGFGGRHLTDMERIFLSIDPEAMRAELRRIVKIANKNRIMLPDDDEFDILVHPDGSWEILVLDLSGLGRLRPLDIQDADKLFENVEESRKDLLMLSMMPK